MHEEVSFKQKEIFADALNTIKALVAQKFSTVLA